MSAEVRLPGLVALVLGALGGVSVLAAWAGSSSTPVVGRQGSWGAVGVAGTFAVIAGSVLWVAAARMAVARRTGELRAVVAARAEFARAALGGATTGLRPAPETAGGEAAPALVATATMVRYHRPRCRLVTGKPVEAAGRAEHERAGRTPCGVCEP